MALWVRKTLVRWLHSAADRAALADPAGGLCYYPARLEHARAAAAAGGGGGVESRLPGLREPPHPSFYTAQVRPCPSHPATPPPAPYQPLKIAGPACSGRVGPTPRPAPPPDLGRARLHPPPKQIHTHTHAHREHGLTSAVGTV